jgi:hypothetical protein
MKPHGEGPKRTRRELFRGAARAGALAAIAVGGWLLARRGRPTAGQSECINNARCRGCSLLADCILPPAQYARAAKGGR